MDGEAQETCAKCQQAIVPPDPVYLLAGEVVCRECHDVNQPMCPHCGADLPGRPVGRGNCSSCNRAFFVRPQQKAYPSTILTARQVIIVDSLKELSRFGLNEDDFFRCRAILTDKHKGEAPKDEQVILKLYKGLLKQCEGHGETAEVQESISKFQRDVGMDSFEARKAWAIATLQNLLKGKITRAVKIKVQGDACEHCAKLADRVYRLEEAIEKLPIPCPECTKKRHPKDAHSACRCEYVPQSLKPEPVEKKFDPDKAGF